ncbi:MAG: RnfABCDGE type electron transport complex subunit C [Lachnospiraceae bacterium]|nr:RnfABCDGE type electron transport complex subunit C [Lachnospiraceae bacterium]
MKHRDFTVFSGGIFPADGSDKKLTCEKPITTYRPKVVEISACQSGPSMCEFQVQVGEHVEKGQCIAIPKTFTAVRLHASVSGTVKEIKTIQKAGRDIPVCVIEADEVQPEVKEVAYRSQVMSLDAFSREQIIAAMEDGGITGMGGAGFPAHIKYSTPLPIEFLLINASECEPYLTCDHRMMLEHGYEIINGANAFMKACGASRCVICIEENKLDAAAELRRIIAEGNLPIKVMTFPHKYPQGGERQLIKAVTDHEIPAGKLPADVGAILSNVQSARAMADMLFGGEPSISRCITITGHVAEPQNFLAPIGTPIRELIEAAGGMTLEKNKVILGGPMTGACLGTNLTAADIPDTLMKVNGGLIVMEDDNISESPCIRCGSCTNACPAGLQPGKINFAYTHGNLELCEKLHATECIGCGSCSYICPAKRELTRSNTAARDAVRAMIRERSKR